MIGSTDIIGYGSSIIESGPVSLAAQIPYANLKGKTVLITGGASGLGAAMARTLAKHEASVIIGDLNEKQGQSLVAELRRISGDDSHLFVPLNVTNWQSQTTCFKEAASLTGRIDCVIASAGITDVAEQLAFESPPNYQAMEHPPSPSLKTLDVNLTGVLLTTNLAISYLSTNVKTSRCSTTPLPGAGPEDRHLLLISSIAGMAPLPSNPLYCASKHGVVGLFRALRMTQPIVNGIRVNMLNPYFVDTPILGPGGAQMLAGGAMAKIEDVVDAAVRLIADKAIVGRALQIAARGKILENEQAGLIPETDGQAIWDVMGHDFEQSDVFTRRIVAVTNIVSAARGWTGILADLASQMISAMKNLVAR